MTAEEFLKDKVTETFSENPYYQKILIDFAKMHVEAALKEVSKELFIDDFTQTIDRDSILNSYPTSNIK